jgi:hypothetical protein
LATVCCYRKNCSRSNATVTTGTTARRPRTTGRIDTIEAQQETRSLLRAALRRQLGGRELETPKLLRSLRGIG